MRRLLTMLACLLCATPVYAQTVTSYPFRIYAQGAPAPTQTTTFAAAAVTCGQTKINPPAGTVANPTSVRFTDPNDATKQCVWTDPGTGILFSLPFGTTVYEATIAAVNSGGTGPESARSNLFSRPGSAPGVLTGLLVVP